jgi:hypothetical protein
MDRRLRALSSSPGDQAKVTQMLGLWDQVANAWNVAAQDIAAGDYSGESTEISNSTTANSQANDTANGLGIGNCASAQL